MPTEQTDLEKRVRELCALLESPEVEPFISRLTDDYVYKSPTRVVRGKEEAAAMHRRIYSVLKSFTVEVISFFSFGDRICVEGVWTGTVKATGRTFLLPAVSIFEMKGDKIKGVTEYFNPIPLQQAGLLPPAPQE